MKPTKALFLFLVALALTACSSDPQWVDPEAHEKTEQLRKQYTPIIAGTWHVEYVKDKGRFFERLTFSADGTFTGMRKWQTRKLVTIDDKEQYTDWEDVELSGTFTGTWQLRYWSPEGNSGEKRNCLFLNAQYEGANSGHMAYSNIATFDYADETTLRFEGFYFKDKDGWITFLRGNQEPSF